MWELDYKESWAPKNSCFWTVVLEKTLESPLDCKGIQPVHPKGNQSWTFIGRTDAEAEAPIVWPPDAKNCLIRKDWCWEKIESRRRRNNRGWDGWMTSLTQWTWVWASSRRWWRTGNSGVLQSMGSKRVGHNWVTEQQQQWQDQIPMQKTGNARRPSEKWPPQRALVADTGFFIFNFYLFIWLHWVFVATCRIFSCSMWVLVPQPGVEPKLPALGAQSLGHWTTREVRMTQASEGLKKLKLSG